MFNNLIKEKNGRTTTKILATLLVITLTFANFALLGTYMLESIAADSVLEEQDNRTNVDNVKFEAYLEEIGKKKISKDINDEDLVLGISIKVENGGYFSEGILEFEDTNFLFPYFF